MRCDKVNKGNLAAAVCCLSPCTPYMYALYVRLICTPYIYALYVRLKIFHYFPNKTFTYFTEYFFIFND